MSPRLHSGRRGKRLSSLADDFFAEIIGTDELVSAISPTIDELDAKQADAIIKRVLSYVDDSISDEFAESLRAFSDALMTAIEKIEEFRIAEIKGTAPVKDSAPTVIQISPPSKMSPAARIAVMDLVRRLSVHNKLGSRAYLIRRSLLVNSVSAFEVFFGGLARQVLSVNKAALNESGHTFTLQDILEFQSIDEAREVIIDRRISSLLHEGLLSWDQWLKKVTKNVQLSTLPLNWQRTQEIFARRNIIVHANGIVNSQYLNAIDFARLDSVAPKIGERLPVDDTYLHASLELLASAGILLVASIWNQFYSDERPIIGKWLLEKQRDLLARDVWQPVIDISGYASSLDLPRSTHVDLFTNGLIARKELHGLNEIQSEVEQWDTSGLDILFGHAKAVLLEEEGAAEEVRKLLKDGRVSIYDIATQPLYRHLPEGFIENIGHPDGFQREDAGDNASAAEG